MVEKLDDEQLSAALIKLNEDQDNPWIVRDHSLHKRFEFSDFISAFGFITQVALVAQQLNHHPNWSNSYKMVEFSLSTHKCGGISELDFNLASRIDQLSEL